MTVSSTSNRRDFNGNGSSKVFPCLGLTAYDVAHVVVVRVAADGTITQLSRPADFSVTGVNTQAGITVTTVVAPASGESLIVRVIQPLTQPTDIKNQGQFYPEVHERVFDRLTKNDQQQQADIDRAVKVPFNDPRTPDEFWQDLLNASDDAQQAAAASEAALYEFKGKYYGALSADPAVDPNGDPVTVGDLYFNTLTGRLRVYDEAVDAWIEQPASTLATPHIFSGDDTTDEFELTRSPINVGNVFVSIGGVDQRPGVDYQIVGPTLTIIRFTTPPQTGSNNVSVIVLSTLDVGVTDASNVQYGSTNAAKILDMVVTDPFVPAIKKLIAIIIWGQSLAEGGKDNDSLAVTTGVRTAERPFNAFGFSGGPVGVQTQTLGSNLVGLSERNSVTVASSMARVLTPDVDSDPYRQIVAMGQAWGGATYAEIKKGGTYGVYEKIIAQVTNLVAAAPGVEIKYVVAIHGEADGLANNTGYQGDLAELQSDFDSDIKALTGQPSDVNLLISQTSSASGYGYVGGITQTTFPTPRAQLAAHIGNPHTVLVGPKYHLAYYDQSHIGNQGERQHGEEIGWCIETLEAGNTWEPLRPTSFQIAGSSIVVTFTEAVAKDTSIVNAAANDGFAYTCGASRTITGIAITAENQITVSLSGAPGSGAVLGYAHHNGDSPGGAAVQAAGNGARGNIRSVASRQSVYEDNPHPLYRWLVHFRQAIN